MVPHIVHFVTTLTKTTATSTDGDIVNLCDDGDGYILNLCDDGGDGYIVNCQQVETPLKGFT